MCVCVCVFFVCFFCLFCFVFLAINTHQTKPPSVKMNPRLITESTKRIKIVNHTPSFYGLVKKQPSAECICTLEAVGELLLLLLLKEKEKERKRKKEREKKERKETKKDMKKERGSVCVFVCVCVWENISHC